MKFGVYLINPPNLPYAAGGRSTEEVGGEAASVTSPGYLRDCARYAEELGFDSIWFPDHVVIQPPTPRATRTRSTRAASTAVTPSTRPRSRSR